MLYVKHLPFAKLEGWGVDFKTEREDKNIMSIKQAKKVLRTGSIH